MPIGSLNSVSRIDSHLMTGKAIRFAWPVNAPRHGTMTAALRRSWHSGTGYYLWEIGERLLAIVEADDLAEDIDAYRDEVRVYDRWLNLDQFDRRETNRRLRAFFQQEEARRRS